MSYTNRRLLEPLSSTISVIPIENIINKTNEYKRRLKGLTEKIVLVDTDVKYESVILNDVLCYAIIGIYCKILSASNKLYNIELSKINEMISYKCSCPDFTLRNVDCKHIYWLGYKKFNTSNPLEWDILNYEKFIIENWILDNYVGMNENCPICLEKINYNQEFTVSCKYSCYNSVHSDCWKQYYDISGKKNCILCRSDSMLYIE
jgi:hypothetical protein